MISGQKTPFRFRKGVFVCFVDLTEVAQVAVPAFVKFYDGIVIENFQHAVLHGARIFGKRRTLDRLIEIIGESAFDRLFVGIITAVNFTLAQRHGDVKDMPAKIGTHYVDRAGTFLNGLLRGVTEFLYVRSGIPFRGDGITEVSVEAPRIRRVREHQFVDRGDRLVGRTLFVQEIVIIDRSEIYGSPLINGLRIIEIAVLIRKIGAAESFVVDVIPRQGQA